MADLLERLSMEELSGWMAFARLQADPTAFDSTDEKLKAAFRRICGKR